MSIISIIAEKGGIEFTSFKSYHWGANWYMVASISEDIHYWWQWKRIIVWKSLWINFHFWLNWTQMDCEKLKISSEWIKEKYGYEINKNLKI